MHKLIIMIGPIADTPSFSDGWPQFLRHAEDMPGLLREASVRVQNTLFGDQDIRMIHELFFATSQGLQSALASPQGRIAGHVLQNITQGEVTLLAAEHKEDDIENLRRYKQESEDVDPQ